MINFKKLTENKAIYYLFPLSMKVNNKTALLNATDIIFDAIRRDRKKGYASEQGPHFAIEVFRAAEYAAYVSEYSTVDNLYRFDTHSYSFVLNALTDEQVQNEEAKGRV